MLTYAETIDVGTGTDTVEFTKGAVTGSVGGAAVVTGMAAGTGADVNRALDSSSPSSTEPAMVSLAATGADMDALHGVDANFTFGAISGIATYLGDLSGWYFHYSQLEGSCYNSWYCYRRQVCNTDKVLSVLTTVPTLCWFTLSLLATTMQSLLLSCLWWAFLRVLLMQPHWLRATLPSPDFH